MSDNKENGKKRKDSLRLIAASGIMAAFVFLGTQLRIPTSIGYMNLGDAVILISSYILGPVAFFPAAIGSALSDLIAGYPVYIAPTFVIKGLMGLIAGLIMKHPQHDPKLFMRIAAGITAELIMVSGYFVFEYFVYGSAPATASVPFNLIQAGAALIIAVPCSYLLKKLKV
ncbi:MAG: ECF transporter S component [Clostridiales bacterium]|nr:ECF transporter S component [Clostridiales bacterium]